MPPAVAVLVEGESDRAAVLALAGRRRVVLDDVDVVAMGGVTNVARYVAELGPRGRGLRLVGMYDAGEERFVRGGLERGGIAVPAELSEAGFHRCDRDLEEELIRALGAERVLEVVAGESDLAAFRGFQQQLVQRTRPVEDQLHRFLGSGSGRKIRYARLLVDALAEDEVPAPLASLVAELS